MSASLIGITLPQLTPDDKVILKQYLNESYRFTGTEWQLLRQALARLEKGRIEFGNRTYPFPQFYRTFINGTYAIPFLRSIEHLVDLQNEGTQAQATVAQRIWQWLQSNGIVVGRIPHAEYLIIYCLAEWGAFARGYLFETMILRELQSAGILTQAHHPVTERFSPYDLYVPGLGYGDIKTSGYFLDDLVNVPATADFYITRVYTPQRRKYMYVAFLTPLAWQRLSDDRPPLSLETVSSLTAAVALLPRGVRLRIEHLEWIVLEYVQWQQSVRRMQLRYKDDE